MAAKRGSCYVSGDPPRHNFASQHSLPCKWRCLSGKCGCVLPFQFWPCKTCASA